MKLSVCPELAKLQTLAGPGACAICLRELPKTKRRQPIVCFSADCRAAMETIYTREWRRTHPGSLALQRVASNERRRAQYQLEKNR